MRISDWSSDVCSSDLPWRRASARRLGGEVAQAVAVGLVAGGVRHLADDVHHEAAPVGAADARESGLQGDCLHLVHGAFVQDAVGVAELAAAGGFDQGTGRSEEHTSELQSLMRISYAVFCLKTKK